MSNFCFRCCHVDIIQGLKNQLTPIKLKSLILFVWYRFLNCIYIVFAICPHFGPIIYELPVSTCGRGAVYRVKGQLPFVCKCWPFCTILHHEWKKLSFLESLWSAEQFVILLYIILFLALLLFDTKMPKTFSYFVLCCKTSVMANC